MPNLASHSRVAFASIASNTGSSSPGELLNDLQHFGGRGLLLQRLGQLARPRLHLVEQPHVLDRDHRLVGEGGDKLDLLVGEGSHRSAHQHDHADRHSLAQQRNAEHGARTASLLTASPNGQLRDRSERRSHGRYCAPARFARRSCLDPGSNW